MVALKYEFILVIMGKYSCRSIECRDVFLLFRMYQYVRHYLLVFGTDDKQSLIPYVRKQRLLATSVR